MLSQPLLYSFSLGLQDGLNFFRRLMEPSRFVLGEFINGANNFLERVQIRSIEVWHGMLPSQKPKYSANGLNCSLQGGQRCLISADSTAILSCFEDRGMW